MNFSWRGGPIATVLRIRCTVSRVIRAAKRIATVLGVIVLLFVALFLTKVNFYLMPFARMTEDGKPVSGYVHRNSYLKPVSYTHLTLPTNREV